MSKRLGNDLSVGTAAGTGQPVNMSKAIRDKHLYVCGATGTGKSKFLEHLIRQDIRGWFNSQSGLLLLDPHGSLYDSVVAWLARANVLRLPIVLIDLRQDEWVISYNALRRRASSNCSVVIDNFVQAMAYVWGASGTDQTPRFARWAANILRTLYENDLTLLEAEYLIDHLDKEARSVLMEKVQDRSSKRDWQFANQLNPRDFESELGSTANRLQRFLRNGHMRSMFGLGRTSLDLRKALDEGYIILVSLACAGARVSEEDADLFATLLLSDLWTAALERGKKPGVKPFYLYLDEFQRFITPSLARNLDEARGFGLHLTMANQFPQQLLDQGAEGQRLYHSVMENASSKAVFRLHSEENLRPLAQWLFRGVMDPDEIKLSLNSRKVVGYREESRVSRTTGRSVTTSTTTTEGTTELQSTGEGAGSSENESYSYLEPRIFRDEPVGCTIGSGTSKTSNEGTAKGRQESAASSEGETKSYSETESDVLVPIMGDELSHVQYRSLDEQLERAMAALFDQKQRQGVVRLAGMHTPVSIETPTVSEANVSPTRLKAYVARLLEKWDFALLASKASEQLTQREEALELRLRQTFAAGEPTSSRRLIGKDSGKQTPGGRQ
jgi:hypothetical protein